METRGDVHSPVSHAPRKEGTQNVFMAHGPCEGGRLLVNTPLCMSSGEDHPGNQCRAGSATARGLG